jgi:hypothetical protein
MNTKNCKRSSLTLNNETKEALQVMRSEYNSPTWDSFFFMLMNDHDRYQHILDKRAEAWKKEKHGTSEKPQYMGFPYQESVPDYASQEIDKAKRFPGMYDEHIRKLEEVKYLAETLYPSEWERKLRSKTFFTRLNELFSLDRPDLDGKPLDGKFILKHEKGRRLGSKDSVPRVKHADAKLTEASK